jgi:hypothetical protein
MARYIDVMNSPSPLSHFLSRGSPAPLLAVPATRLSCVEGLVCAAKAVPEGSHGSEARVHALFALVVEVVHVAAKHARQAVPDAQRGREAVSTMGIHALP